MRPLISDVAFGISQIDACSFYRGFRGDNGGRSPAVRLPVHYRNPVD